MARNQKKKSYITAGEAEAAYLRLGPDRSLAMLRKALDQAFNDSPAISTIKNWSVKNGWDAKAAAFDLKQENAVIAQLTVERVTQIFHAREELQKVASNCLKAFEKWSENKNGKTAHIKDASDARTILDSAISAIKMAEVLEGRVSDRQAQEKNIALEDRRAEAQRRAEENLARLRERYSPPQPVIEAQYDETDILE